MRILFVSESGERLPMSQVNSRVLRSGGQVYFRRVKVMCVDVVSLIFSRHFRVHCSILRRWAWMFIEAVTGFEWVAIIAVSSANVLRTVVEVCGISAVYSVYWKGPRMLPCGTPECILTGEELTLL